MGLGGLGGLWGLLNIQFFKFLNIQIKKMGRFVSVIPGAPRSSRFRYYTPAVAAGGGGGGGVTVPAAPGEDFQEVAYVDTYGNIPTPPTGGLKLVITQDTNEIYSWDDDSGKWVNTTPKSGVTRIIAGMNVTVSPVSGLGEVTVNAVGGGGGGGSQTATVSGYYVVAVPAGVQLQDTVATGINIASGLPSGGSVTGATYLIPGNWAFPVTMALNTALTTAYLYCTLESTRSTPSTSYILVQYQRTVTLGTVIVAGANVTVTGEGSAASPYVVSSDGSPLVQKAVIPAGTTFTTAGEPVVVSFPYEGTVKAMSVEIMLDPSSGPSYMGFPVALRDTGTAINAEIHSTENVVTTVDPMTVLFMYYLE
jgi:hypothetical protein